MNSFLWILVSIVGGALWFYSWVCTPLRYPVPSIWQKKGCSPGDWNDVLVFYPLGGNRYRPGIFHDSRDYISNQSLRGVQVNGILDDCIRNRGYQQLPFMQYAQRYGLQSFM